MNLKEKIIYVNDKPHIKCNVLLLFSPKGGNLFSTDTSPLLRYSDKILYENILCQVYPFNLYFISNEEIKDGDWCFNSYDNQIWKYKPSPCPIPYWGNKDTLAKIIATTDTSLKINKFNSGASKELEYSLPHLSEQFINDYIKEYNKGNIITKVEVEYEEYWIKAEYSLDVAYRPVINSDCTINIKPIKDSWSREEVESLIREWASFTVTGKGQWWKPNDLDNWIKENL